LGKIKISTHFFYRALLETREREPFALYLCQHRFSCHFDTWKL